MSTRVVNVGMHERDTNGRKSTNVSAAIGNQGTVSVWYQNIQYTFGPGDSKVLEDGIAAALVAADGRLRIADSRDGHGSKGVS